MLIVLFFEIAANYSEFYSKQCNEILNKNLYRFNTDKQRDFILKELDDYINDHPIKTIALPSISTGAYSYPLDEACNIALDEILSFINNSPDTFDEIAMVCLDEKTYNMYKSLYEERLQK